MQRVCFGLARKVQFVKNGKPLLTDKGFDAGSDALHAFAKAHGETHGTVGVNVGKRTDKLLCLDAVTLNRVRDVFEKAQKHYPPEKFIIQKQGGGFDSKQKIRAPYLLWLALNWSPCSERQMKDRRCSLR